MRPSDSIESMWSYHNTIGHHDRGGDSIGRLKWITEKNLYRAHIAEDINFWDTKPPAFHCLRSLLTNITHAEFIRLPTTEIILPRKTICRYESTEKWQKLFQMPWCTPVNQFQLLRIRVLGNQT
jgi:hypothetical protein